MEYNKPLSTEERQRISLEILLFFHNFCREHNITYYLAYGTLLGAVRHHGFIPWDDDVDIHIPRPDYERILREFSDPSDNFELISPANNNRYTLPYAKIQNKKTRRITKNGEIDNKSFGIGIDLFPLDGVPDDLENAKKAFKKANKEFFSVLWRFDTYRRMENPSSLIEKVKHAAGKLLFSAGALTKEAQRLGRNLYSVDYDKSRVVACVVGIHSGRFCPFNKEWFEKEELMFEGRPFSVPKGYHEILTLVYGDYMTPPEKSEQITTHSDNYILIK